MPKPAARIPAANPAPATVTTPAHDRQHDAQALAETQLQLLTTTGEAYRDRVLLTVGILHKVLHGGAGHAFDASVMDELDGALRVLSDRIRAEPVHFAKAERQATERAIRGAAARADVGLQRVLGDALVGALRG